MQHLMNTIFLLMWFGWILSIPMINAILHGTKTDFHIQKKWLLNWLARFGILPHFHVYHIIILTDKHFRKRSKSFNIRSQIVGKTYRLSAKKIFRLERAFCECQKKNFFFLIGLTTMPNLLIPLLTKFNLSILFWVIFKRSIWFSIFPQSRQKSVC